MNFSLLLDYLNPVTYIPAAKYSPEWDAELNRLLDTQPLEGILVENFQNPSVLHSLRKHSEADYVASNPGIRLVTSVISLGDRLIWIKGRILCGVPILAIQDSFVNKRPSRKTVKKLQKQVRELFSDKKLLTAELLLKRDNR